MIEAAFCLIFGGTILTMSFLRLRDDIKSKKYPRFEATFLDANILKDEGSYQVKLSYEYNFGGKTYPFVDTAKSYTGNVSNLFLSAAEEKANSFKEKNEPILLYVNPDQPHKARTEAGIDPITIAVMIFGFAFFAVGVRLFLYD